jgi:hypothetical protein
MTEAERIKAEISEVLENNRAQYYGWIYFADKLLSFYYKGKEIDKTGEDIVHDIIKNLYCGEMDRKRDDNPDISKFMYSRIRGCISNLVDNHYYSKRNDQKELPDEDLFICPGDLDYIINKNNLRELTREIISDDDDCAIVFEYLVDGYNDNKSIAKDLGISVTKVSDIKRKIKYRIEKNLYKFK